MARIVIACDKFKGSATASEVAEALRLGIADVLGEDAEVTSVPVADGGDGTTDAALSISFERHTCRVTGPFGRPTEAVYAYDPGRGTAVLEVAEACGLGLIPSSEVGTETADGKDASSSGVGELIAHALDKGARRIILGLGGSATTDGGAGMIAGLGARLLTDSGDEVGPGGAGLKELAAVDLSGLDSRIAEAEIVIASDVTNPLCGGEGAAAVYGPQKGVASADVPDLDDALSRFAGLVEGELRVGSGSFAETPGAGAAGGLGFASLAVLGGTMESGADLVLDLVGFDRSVDGANLVITGEGRFDAQTLQGKAPARVAQRAREAGVRTVAICGATELSAAQVRDVGIEEMYALTDVEPDVARCLAEPLPLIRRLGRRIASNME